ncbi:hypothetical protein GGQ74_002708 [Desulfobaculum xiamenense]|uniref:Uncharacterized protein n=1 Tax=Desulfobaculum xiamenense TaxID=995050 RepID=A0A846QV74_9BACT|nr:hypothetical protein [Desulfobaculum xiamenense]NJB69014.1 hypothetical protein [Desulfobaculum xiamenense]
MAISGVYNSLTDQMNIKLKQDENEEARARQRKGDEPKDLDDVTFSSMGDRLSTMVRKAPMSNVLDGMDTQMNELKDRFLETVRKGLRAKGIDDDDGKFSLSKDKDGNFVVSGDYAHADVVEQMLKDDPKLAKAYDQIAEMSELTRKVQYNPSVMRARTGLAAYMSMADDGMFGASFQMLISGSSMNTFWM